MSLTYMASVLPLKLDPCVGVDGGGMKDRFIKTTYSRILLLKKTISFVTALLPAGAVGQMRSKPRTTSYLPLRQPLLKSPYLFNRCLMKIEIQSVRLFQPIYLFIYTTKIKKLLKTFLIYIGSALLMLDPRVGSKEVE